ncbi:unnamed protein product [Moneuplotes crassus]|uniref:Uncharacterized protein n=1 Tax=Euplotes crassus TaxID=5936 RepID=A0AAD1XA59_EUPCR|nr:unnamed protein product [Moneuplotes crassus]
MRKSISQPISIESCQNQRNFPRRRSIDEIQEKYLQLKQKANAMKESKPNQLQSYIQRYSMINLEYRAYAKRINFNIEYNKTPGISINMIKMKSKKLQQMEKKLKRSQKKKRSSVKLLKPQIEKFAIKLKESQKFFNRMRRKFTEDNERELANKTNEFTKLECNQTKSRVNDLVHSTL